MALSEFDIDKAHEEMGEAYASVQGMLDLSLDPQHEAIASLAATWADIDEWLSKGGRPPAAWSPLNKNPEVRA